MNDGCVCATAGVIASAALIAAPAVTVATARVIRLLTRMSPSSLLSECHSAAQLRARRRSQLPTESTGSGFTWWAIFAGAEYKRLHERLRGYAQHQPGH